VRVAGKYVVWDLNPEPREYEAGVQSVVPRNSFEQHTSMNCNFSKLINNMWKSVHLEEVFRQKGRGNINKKSMEFSTLLCKASTNTASSVLCHVAYIIHGVSEVSFDTTVN
jgi:hypothetical protein